MKNFKWTIAFTLILQLLASNMSFAAQNNPAVELMKNVGASLDRGESIEEILSANQDALSKTTQADWQQVFTDLQVDSDQMQSIWNSFNEGELTQALELGLRSAKPYGLTWSGESSKDDAVIAGLAMIGAGAVLGAVGAMNNSSTLNAVGTSVAITGVCFIGIVMFYGIP